MSLRVSTPPAAKSASANELMAALWMFVSNQVRALLSSVATPFAVTLSVLPVPPKYTLLPLVRRTSSLPAPALIVMGTLSICWPLTEPLLSWT